MGLGGYSNENDTYMNSPTSGISPAGGTFQVPVLLDAARLDSLTNNDSISTPLLYVNRSRRCLPKSTATNATVQLLPCYPWLCPGNLKPAGRFAPCQSWMAGGRLIAHVHIHVGDGRIISDMYF